MRKQLVAVSWALALRLRRDFTQDRPQGHPADGRMQERRIQVDGVVMAATLFPEVDHPVVPEISHNAPDGSFRETQFLRDLSHRRVSADGEEEEDAPLGGEQRPTRPAVTIGISDRAVRPPTSLPFGFIPDSLFSSHDTSVVDGRLPYPISATG